MKRRKHTVKRVKRSAIARKESVKDSLLVKEFWREGQRKKATRAGCVPAARGWDGGVMTRDRRARSRAYFVGWHVFAAAVTLPLWLGPFLRDVWRLWW